MRVVEFLRDNVVRVYAFAVAVVALVLHYAPGLPGDLILGIVAAALAMVGGEAAQRLENRKTDRADSVGYRDGFQSGTRSRAPFGP